MAYEEGEHAVEDCDSGPAERNYEENVGDVQLEVVVADEGGFD